MLKALPLRAGDVIADCHAATQLEVEKLCRHLQERKQEYST